MSMAIFQIIGFSGMAIILIAFLLNQAKRWSADSISYDIANAVGSTLLVVYAVALKSYPFLILNAIWAVASIKDIFTDLREMNKAYRAKIGHKSRGRI